MHRDKFVRFVGSKQIIRIMSLYGNFFDNNLIWLCHMWVLYSFYLFLWNFKIVNQLIKVGMTFFLLMCNIDEYAKIYT